MNKTVFITFFLLIFSSFFRLAAHAQPNIIPNQYIVVLSETADSHAVARAAATTHNGTVKHIYADALNGFAMTLPPQAVSALERNPHVVAIVPDQRVETQQRPCRPNRPCTPTPSIPTETPTNTPIPTDTPIPTATATSAGTGSQSIPNNILRVNGDSSSTRSGDGTGVVEVDIAVIDTGIDVDHPDLNVVGGYNCHTGGSDPADYDDDGGHGTHVAGIIAARDNTFGVVGVAPGARLWSIRIFDEDGLANVSDIVCGLDWVYQNRDVIDVVNISAGGGGSDSSCNNIFDPLHQVVCAVYAAGIPIVVAAGNEGLNSNDFVPATFDEVITVSNLVDSDGGPGGVGGNVCNEADDTYSAINNYGEDIDMIAPGTCITSTWVGGAYATVSGTSAAAPHVAGALAVYLHDHPAATRDEMIAAVFTQSTLDWDGSSDPDGVQELLLNVGTAQDVTPTPTATSENDAISTPTTTPTPIPTQPSLPTTTPFPTATLTPTVTVTPIPTSTVTFTVTTIPTVTPLPTVTPTPTAVPVPLTVTTADMQTQILPFARLNITLIIVLLIGCAIILHVFVNRSDHTN